MLKVNLLVLEKYLDRVTTALGEGGLMHLINAPAQSLENLLGNVDCRDEIRRLEPELQRCDRLMKALDLSPDPAAESPLSPGEVAEILKQVDQECAKADEEINRLIAESGTLAETAARLENFPLRRIRFSTLRDLNYLYLANGTLPPAQLPGLVASLSEEALVMQQSAGDKAMNVLVLTSRKKRWSVDTELKRAGFTEAPLPTDGEGTAIEEGHLVEDRLAAISLGMQAHRDQMTRLKLEWGGRLQAIQTQLQTALDMARAKQNFGQASGLYCLSGWLPKAEADRARKLVELASAGTAVLEFVEPGQDEAVRDGRDVVPVKFVENRFLQPFQALVAGFGAPRYNEIDPSVFVTLTFVLMFGLMFGDVGQGLVIALGGVYMLRSKRPLVLKHRNSGSWLLLCGISAMIFGVLYGSVFGNEHLLPKLWVNPLHDVLALFKATVYVGIVCISAGVIINIVNRLRARQYLEGLFDKFGVIGILFYWGSLGVGLKAAYAGRLSLRGIAIFVILPLIILFIREPLYNLVTRKPKLLHEDLLSFVLTSGVEVMETVTTFLGSTVSFVRLGGFALSHAALCLAIYSVVDMLKTVAGGTFWAALLIVVGNLFVIVLEGLVVTIQGVRLQYYELFSKYFPGDGVLYSPFRLKRSRQKEQEKEA
jgi:V/A-type H+-transporting ATPase subunit I